MMGIFKSVKTLGTLKGMKKIGKQLGKIIPTTKVRKAHVEQSLGSDKIFDIEYHVDTGDLKMPLLSSNKYRNSSDPESNSTRMNSGSITDSICDMCVKSIHLEDLFNIKGCNHLYCRQCILDFVVLKLNENVTSIVCPEPNCRAALDPEYCRPILPNLVIDRWVSALYDQSGQSCNAEITSTNSPESSPNPSASDPSSTFICDMCVKPAHLEDSFDILGCNHFYCRQCIVDFVLSKLEDNVASIVCPEPGCRGILEPKYCRPILPRDLFDWWINTLSGHNGQPSDPETNTTFTCKLCAEPNHLEDSFDVKGCNHFYCRQCIVNFVLSKLDEHNVTSVACPEAGCRGVLDPEYCRPFLPKEVLVWWENALHDQNGQSSNHEIYDSNDTSTFICDFCVESIPLEDSFNIKGCSHFYCQQCIANFVVSKLQDNVTSIACPEPGCTGVLDPEYCRPILPNDIYDRWGKALCENVIMGSESTMNYFYCPFADCSALLILEEQDDNDESQCPHCERVICAKCKVPWHVEFGCDEFQRLRDKGEDEMVKELAKKNKWRKCPKCNYYVEKADGCMYIKCRCGYAFCYNCGIKARTDHHTRHCPNCKQ